MVLHASEESQAAVEARIDGKGDVVEAESAGTRIRITRTEEKEKRKIKADTRSDRIQNPDHDLAIESPVTRGVRGLDLNLRIDAIKRRRPYLKRNLAKSSKVAIMPVGKVDYYFDFYIYL